MNLKGTKTEANLMAAFAGESQARNKYTYYASKAKKDGYEQIAALFLETADNEKEHAKIWFKLLPTRHDQRRTPTLNSNRPLGYRRVKRIAKKATTLTTANAIHRTKSTMKCGIASNHLTSQSQRLSCGESSPESRSG
jgi:rubrerythrin